MILCINSGSSSMKFAVYGLGECEKTDEDKAFRMLATMIPGLEDRRMALALAREIVTKGSAMSARQETVLSRMNKALDV